MLTFSHIPYIEALFSTMEPAHLAGEPFTPSLRPEELVLEDISAELEIEEEIVSINEAKLGPFTPFGGSNIPVPLAAVDAGVLDIGVSLTGFALAFKAAVVIQELDGTHIVIKIGPRVKFIEPDNRTELLHFIGRELMNEEMFIKVEDDGSLSIKAGSTEPNQFLSTGHFYKLFGDQ